MKRVTMLALLIFAGCQSPPAPPPISTAPPEPTTTVRPAHELAPAAVVVHIPRPVVAPATEPSLVDAKNAADREAMKTALQRASQVATEPRPQAEVTAPSEVLSERDLAAAREALPALQERIGHVIKQHFDADTLRRALTNHPEFRKE